MLTQKFRERTDTVSFRIGSGIRLSLEEEAKKNGVSLNTLVSQIFTYHTAGDGMLGD
jgi:predicted HicB family RNase H-like nuclease